MKQLYGIIVLMAAFLAFLVQPMMAKYMLPWFGGGAGVWSACLLFFQSSLFLAYLYAAIVSSLAMRLQYVVHLALLLVSLAFLPVIPSYVIESPEARGANPLAPILMLLCSSIGIPYVVLASTSPLMQMWYGRTLSVRPPYYLYAVSNVGSFAALLCFPSFIEPFTSRNTQAYAWSCAYCAFVILLMILVSHAWRAEARGRPSTKCIERDRGIPRSALPTWSAVLMWIMLSTLASATLMSATSQLTEEIAPVPLIWIVPLACYLGTFVFGFAWPNMIHSRYIGAVVILGPWVYTMLRLDARASIITQAATVTVIMTACCLVCISEIYRTRPGLAHLTWYYVAQALGGAIGSAFVLCIGPLLFSAHVEYVACMLVAMALMLYRCIIWLRRYRSKYMYWPMSVSIAAFAVVTATHVYGGFSKRQSHVVYAARNFYGAVQVRRVSYGDFATHMATRLDHGRTMHGAQLDGAKLQLIPITYYGLRTGIGMIMQMYQASSERRIGVVGLGVGTMAAYGRTGDVIRFYELDREMVNVANTHFSYLRDSLAKVSIALGDARLVMDAEVDQEYDIIVLDAFSGDAIPVHLLTREAFAVYRRHLLSNGVIAVHVSNRHLALDKMVRALAAEQEMSTVYINAVDTTGGFVVPSQWMLVTNNSAWLQEFRVRGIEVMPPSAADVRAWTDEYSSVLMLLR